MILKGKDRLPRLSIEPALIELNASALPLGVGTSDRLHHNAPSGLQLHCLSAKDGKVSWSLKTGNSVHGTPSVDDTAAYLAGCDEVFRAVRLSDGQPLFTLPIGAYTGVSVALQQNQAFFGTFNNDVMALDLPSKKLLCAEGFGVCARSM